MIMADEKGPMYESVSPRSEEEILRFWKENKIFEKSLENRQKAKTFVFFEGPPYANGLPGIHHVESRSFKDIILRYKTMRGFFVPRRAGWDTHGLPTEMAVEKALGIKSKKEIEEKIGVEKFVEEAKKNVFTFIDAWEKLTDRMAYWLDLKNAYVTMTNDYIESLWAVISKISEKKLLYEDYKVLPWCPRCGTSLSSHELAQGYQKVKENSIYVKFQLEGDKSQNQRVSFLVWTTTPWTLPGNVALAINPKIDYVTVERSGNPDEWLILAEARLDVVEGEYKIINREKGAALVGTKYKALYSNSSATENSYRVIAASFVGAEDGSGIVHIAPAFGGDDLAVGKKEKLPTLVTVSEEGKMKTPGAVWDGKFIKDADLLIIEDLKKRLLLFKIEPYEHDYPFCWRCGTALMYYAKTSWFFKTTAVRDHMLRENAKIDWHPEYLRDGRFGSWLKENVDWGISRERYWGTPLPVWRCDQCEKIKVAGSLKELDNLDLHPTELIVMRHGEVPHNIKDTTNPVDPEKDEKETLTEKGKADVREAAKKLKKEKINLIFSSPSHRARETASIIAEELGLPESVIAVVPELYDVLVGGFEGVPINEYEKAFSSFEAHFTEKPKGAENFREIRSRMIKAVIKLRRNYAGKKILIISHGHPTWILMAALESFDEKDYLKSPYLNPGEFKKINLHNWPYNSAGELDLHKPYIDEIKLKCEKCAGEMARVKEVMDVWFDSGAMPFASQGFGSSTSKGKSNFLYPAEYIAEAIDQTRGWFYTLLSVSALLGFESSYKRVLSLGLVLDGKGEKMSKSKGNVVDPETLMEKYGADAVRWYFYTINQPWDDKLFREKDIQDAQRRFLMILWNSYLYWRTYREVRLPIGSRTSKPKLVINKWLLAKWNKILSEVSENLEKYDIVSAARKLENFVVEDLSHWYIRRIREHMKHEKSDAAKECSATLGFVLLELSKTLAPFTPFISEGIYRGISGEKESVHLEDFPAFAKASASKPEKKLIEEMEKTREIVSRGLEARQKAGIKIRQPLSELKIKNKLDNELLELIKGEVNVKKVSVAKDLKEEVELDTEITNELQEEGLVREFIRAVQDFRKELKLTPQEKVELAVKSSKEFEKILKEHKSLIEKEINISNLFFGDLGDSRTKEILIDKTKAEIGINHTHHMKIENE